MLNQAAKFNPVASLKSFFLVRFLSFLKLFFNLKPLWLLREAFMSLLPIVLVMNILVMFSEFTNLLEGWGIANASAISGEALSRLYTFSIPLFVSLSLSSLLAKEKDLEQIGTMLIAMVCFFRLSGFLVIQDNAQLVSEHGSIFASIPCTWLAVGLLHYFSNVLRARFIARQKDLGPQLRRTLALIAPGLLTVLSFELMGHCIQYFIQMGAFGFVAQALPRINSIGQIPELILYKIVSLGTWFVGLHGEHSAEGLFRLLHNTPASEEYNIQLKVFHNVFMNIGGSGSTFVIPIIVLCSQRITHFKSVAKLGLPFSFFNVNEILLYGLPILLNPIFLVPFLLVPFVNMAIALLAIHLGLFELPSVVVHWMAPPIYSAYVSTGGSGGAVITQLVCLVTDGFLYFPFLLLTGRQYQAPLYLLKLFGEDAYGFINEEINHQQERLFIAKQQAVMKDLTAAQKVLKQLQGGQFLLYFQPKFDARSLKLVGLEALLRFQNHKDDILSPTFLPVLYQQGLSKVVDKKVVNLAFWQILRWRSIGLKVPPIAINFDKDFLLDTQAVQEFINRANQHKIRFYIEITEHTYTIELEALARVIQQLRAAGHRISIDDFGAGYSSLTTLLALKADEIKLDRKLVIAPEEEARRGQILLATSIRLCHDLGFSVVAEGVETIEQLQQAQDCGADVIQGYHLGQPMSPKQVSALFETTFFPPHTQ